MRSGLRPNSWHFEHFIDPRAYDESSNMPSYAFLLDRKTDIKGIPGKIKGQVRVGVPYEAMTKDVIMDKAKLQAQEIAISLIKDAKVSVPGMVDAPPEDQITKLQESELIALIAYVQKIGAYETVEPKEKGRRLISPPDNNHTTSNN